MEPVASVKISIAIMSHPARREMAERLRQKLGPDVVIVYDPKPFLPASAVRTALLAWGAYGAGTTHHVVLQDDIHLANNFLPMITKAVQERPESVIGLCAEWRSLTGQAVRMAAYAGCGWTPVIDENVWAAGIVVPVGLIDPLLAELGAGTTTSDSRVLARFARRHHVPLVAIVPNLIQHDARSVASSLWPEKRVLGPRRAACFVESGERPVEWRGRVLRPLSVPHIPWDGLAACVAIEGSSRSQRKVIGSREYLERAGESVADLTEYFLRNCGSLTARAAKACHISYLFEIWLTGYLVGRILRDDHDCEPNTTNVCAVAGSLTMAMAPLSRVMPEENLSVVGAVGEELLRASLLLGSDWSSDRAVP